MKTPQVDWLRENIKFMLAVIALISFIGGIAADIIPRPALASDLDKLASTVQKLADIQVESAINYEIRIKQSEIRAIRRDYSRGDVMVSQDSQIAIDTLLDEIDELRWQRDNPK